MTPRPFVSVVTPVYNGGRYLAECVASVRAQTHRDWELVILDNCSTDDTARVAEESAAGDARIRIRRAEHFLDIYGNHNRALAEVSPAARYVKVVHADDWLAPECLERMVAVAEEHPATAVVSAFRMEGKQVMHDGLIPYGQPVMSGREVVRHALLGPPWVTGSPTSLLFRADVVRARPRFYDQTVWHADTDAAYRVLMQADLGFVHQVLTFTRVHPGALTSFSLRANSFLPGELRMTLRYGPAVLGEDDYRATSRRQIEAYALFLAKQKLRQGRHRDAAIRDFHRREAEHLVHEAGHDRRALRLLRLCRVLAGPAPVAETPDGLPDGAVAPS